MPGERSRTGAASERIARELATSGCRNVCDAESLLVANFRGPLAEGEIDRASAWALNVAAQAASLSA